MPLAFTQEDFLVLGNFDKSKFLLVPTPPNEEPWISLWDLSTVNARVALNILGDFIPKIQPISAFTLNLCISLSAYAVLLEEVKDLFRTSFILIILLLSSCNCKLYSINKNASNSLFILFH